MPKRIEDVLLQGPHIGICTPFAKQPRPTGRNQKDYEAWDLVSLPESVIPRTNWQPSENRSAFDAAIKSWDGEPNTVRYRLIARRQLPSNTARSVFVSLLPPGPSAMGVCFLGALENETETVALAGFMAGLLADFYVRSTGASDLQDHVLARIPVPPVDTGVSAAMIHRTLRLNCLTREFAELWERLVDPSWADDDFTQPERATRSISFPPPVWDISVPVRTELDRWLLLTELDALSALIIGVEPDGLVAVYNSQFPVLRTYEHQMVFDAHGRQICGHFHQQGVLQAHLEAEARSKKTRGWVRVWDRVHAHLASDADVDLGPFVPPFQPADRVAAMTGAYEVFAQRFGLEGGRSAS